MPSIGLYPEPAELEGLFEAIAGVRVAVVGDYCLDWYFDIDSRASERSVETGRPTWPVRSIRTSPGGAGNVAANLAALGVRGVRCFGVVGPDPFAPVLLDHLRQFGCDLAGMVTQRGDWTTPTYMKPLVDGVEQHRIDSGVFNALSDRTAKLLLDSLEREAAGVDVLIVNQQLANGGIHTPELRSRLSTVAAGVATVVLDSRDHVDGPAGAVRKLNEREAASVARALGLAAGADGSTAGVAAALAGRWNAAVVATRGADGVIVAGSADRRVQPVEIPGIAADGAVDPVGAGDAFLASFAAALGAGIDVASAARLGNFAASVTVRKLGTTGTAAPDEILRAAANVVYRYRPERATASPTGVDPLPDSAVEVVTAFPTERAVMHVIFDHDGTISTLREGWESVMEPMMVAAILGRDRPGPEDAQAAEVRDAVREYIGRTTGVQTLVQMEGLRDLVRRFGLAPESQIRTAAGYKAVYNAALMEVVNRRTEELERGELSVADVTMKGSVELLRRLAAAGRTLYLASGTDEEDVVQEARLLGYAELFTGGIHGARGRIDHEPKRLVLQSILAGIRRDGGDPRSIVVVGDGPVEISEGVRAGALCIGVASDEVRRCGLNPEKRRRLILAGADLIVPDYSSIEPLTRLLEGGARGEEP